MESNTLESTATKAYAAFPKSLRPSLHARILADPESPFREGPDETWTGRGFAIALSDYSAPITNCSLPELLNCMGLSDRVRAELVATFVRWMAVLQPVP